MKLKLIDYHIETSHIRLNKISVSKYIYLIIKIIMWLAVMMYRMYSNSCCKKHNERALGTLLT